MTINLKIEEDSELLLDVGEVTYISDMPVYEGSYQITPKKQQIVLPTRQKAMTDDVTIFQIPYSSVDNLAGGQTVTIGIE